MAIQLTCDGCGKPGDPKFGDLTEIQGAAPDPGLYCEDCAPDVHAYIEERDKLHDKVAKQWQTGVEKLTAAFRKKHPEGKLPDEVGL